MTDDQSGRYRRAAHAVQTATKMLANLIYGEASKDYVDNRTGLNIQMAEFGGLLDLLVRKGVITELERDETLIAALTSGDVEVRIRARKLLDRLAVEDLWDGTQFEPRATPLPPPSPMPRKIVARL